MEVKQIGLNCVQQYKALRLTSLREHPFEFSSSYEEEVNKPLEFFLQRLNQNHVISLGAYLNNELIGMVTLVFETKKKLLHRASLSGLYVVPRYRRTGVGRVLINAAMDEVRKKEFIEQIHLSVSSKNKAAVKLYQSFGFSIYGTEKNALKVDEQSVDVNLMMLSIS